jgi:hypothetical protein
VLSALLVALLARGRLHADEIFQALEPASQLAFGFSERVWEWQAGVRNWAVPGLLAGLLRLVSALGATKPMTLAISVWTLGGISYGLGTIALHRWVRSREGQRAANFAALLHVSWGALLLYAARPLSDAACLTPLLWGLERTERSGSSNRLRDGFAAGLGLGLAVVFRYGSAIFALVALFGLLRQRRWRGLGGLALGGALVLVGLGLLDQLTWGEFLHSLRAYSSFNQPFGQVVKLFGARSWWWYLTIYAGMAPLFLLPFQLRALKRLDLPALCAIVYALAIELHPHKEARFLLPLLPLGEVLGASGALAWLDRFRERTSTRRWQVFALIAFCATWSVASATVLKPINLKRALVDAVMACGARPETGGMLVSDDAGWNSAGRFYLHRASPIFLGEGQTEEAKNAALHDPRYGCAALESDAFSESALREAGWTLVENSGGVRRWERRK